MKTLLLALALALALALPCAEPALAAPDAATGTSALPWVRAEVKKLDVTTGRITLRHDDIPNLEMPGMTMVFRLADPKLAAGVKAGDTVRVAIEKVKGQLTVIRLEPAN